MNERDKKAELDDLELVRRGMQAAQALNSLPPGLGLSMQSAEAARAPEDDEPGGAESIVTQEDEQQAKQVQTLFKKGYRILATHVKQGAVEGEFSASANTESIRTEEIRIPKAAVKLIEDSRTWIWLIGTKSALQGNCTFSDNVLLNFYEIATTLYNDKAYDKALAAFTCLVHLNPLVSSFWVGQGLALEGLQRYEDAVEALENALLAAPADFEPMLAIMRCSDELKDYERLTQLLEERKDVESMKDQVATALAVLADKTR